MNLLGRRAYEPESSKRQNFSRNNVLDHETEKNSKGMVGLLPGASKNYIREGMGNYGRKETQFYESKVYKDFNIIRGF